MKKFSLLIVGVLLMLASCKQKNLELFNQENAGSNVYLKKPFDMAVGTMILDTTGFEFYGLGFVPAKQTDTVIRLVVAVTGNAMATDRHYKIAIDPASTMKGGKDYEFLNEPLIRANRYTDTLSIKVHRTPAMKDSNLVLTFSLAATQELQVEMPYKRTSATAYRDSISLLRYSMVVNDIPSKPYLWTNPTYASNALNYFGAYSAVKVQLMVQAMNLNIADFTIMPAGGFSFSNFGNWSKYFSYWLAVEKSNGNVYYDEFGALIEMGKYGK
ncbi:DUF4843 domain-containing protein [Chitinophaga sp. Cy-1792]|uniref:DUF4843 domain-containing protein n=1 Tax=Chitinophaga sp. Cy-1792 TaxID=2608339 RepID=UPI00141F5639|nr:DUF4843 domain-containing protein [Chitinophaga sp. Cy-1792]